MEREYLRELAKRYLEIANLPVMKEREQLWYRHNSLKSERPVIVVEMGTFERDVMPELKCESDFGRRVEADLLRAIVSHEYIDDDKVVSPYFEVPHVIRIRQFDMEQRRIYAKDMSGRTIGFKEVHPIEDLEEDFPKLRHSTCRYDAEATDAYRQFALDTLGDLMPVKTVNHNLDWFFTPSQRIIELMGMEALMYAMVDTPELVTELYDFIVDDMLMILDWEEKNGLLTMNNGNHYAGAGSYGFCDELKEGSPVTAAMRWANLNSQETVGISPKMFHDFVYPAYERLAKPFGLVYYGCCEPVDKIWDDIKNLPHLRKVSVSAWCDEPYMGEHLRGGNIIYSRKPSPNFIGVGRELDEEAYRKHIDYTLNCAKGCTLEILHRDIYALSGNRPKVKRAVNIIREEIDRLW